MSSKARVDLVLDCADREKLTGFWQEALDYRVHYAGGSHAVLVPKEGISPPLVLQQVLEPKVGKNRMHVDLVTDEIDAEVARLETLGARRLHDGVQAIGSTRWVTMADPEGNEFCVCTGVEW